MSWGDIYSSSGRPKQLEFIDKNTGKKGAAPTESTGDLERGSLLALGKSRYAHAHACEESTQDSGLFLYCNHGVSYKAIHLSKLIELYTLRNWCIFM